MSNPNRNSGVQIDPEFVLVYADSDGILEPWEAAWTEHCIRRLCPAERDTLMPMLGLTEIQRDPGSKHCPRCDTTKLKTDFYKSATTRTGVSSYCKICHAVDLKESKERVRKRRQRKEV